MIVQIGQFRIDLVTQDKQIMFLYHFCNCFQILLFHNRPGRVIWERHNKKLCLRRDCSLKFFCRQAEFVLCL